MEFGFTRRKEEEEEERRKGEREREREQELTDIPFPLFEGKRARVSLVCRPIKEIGSKRRRRNRKEETGLRAIARNEGRRKEESSLSPYPPWCPFPSFKATNCRKNGRRRERQKSSLMKILGGTGGRERERAADIPGSKRRRESPFGALRREREIGY